MPTIMRQSDTRVAGVRRAFTLIELLVAIAIISIVATISVVAVSKFSEDVRQSSGVNAVLAAVEEARATALRNNNPVVVVFRAVLEEPGNLNSEQYTELVIAEWTGESVAYGSLTQGFVADRFLPVVDSKPRRLPDGIKVAGPFYSLEDDNVWVTQPQFANCDPNLGSPEVPGEMIGIMFGPNGQMQTANERSIARELFVDFVPGDNDGLAGSLDFYDGAPNWIGPDYYHYNEPDDESVISLVPFVAVYDDDAAREVALRLPWTSTGDLDADLTGPTGYISQFADRIHFNRYTGVAMR